MYFLSQTIIKLVLCQRKMDDSKTIIAPKSPQQHENQELITPKKTPTISSSNKRKNPAQEALSEEAKASLKAKRIKLSGLRNLGNTCYMNSVLQCLSNIQRFTVSVGEPPCGGNRRNEESKLLFETLRDTMYLLKKSGKAAIIPESIFTMLCKVPRFRGYQQQDAHEFLRYVLDRLHQECLDNRSILIDEQKQPTTGRSSNANATKKASLIGNIFGGILQNEVNCLECGFKSHKQDPFLDLSLDIPSLDTPSSNNSDNSNSSYLTNEEYNLIDCLSSFIELEELTETELYYCTNCQQKQRSTKRFWIRRLPDVLCLHLKRFRYNNYLRTKIDNYIKFPIQGLDMKRFVTVNKHETRGSSCGPTTYDLVAFIEHHGSGVGSGHYTAFCRHDNYWFHFDDSSVTVCDESKVRQSKAYILFYNRRQT